MTEDRRQKSEDRGQKSEDRGQKSEDRGQKTEDRGQKSEDRGQKTEDRRQKTEDRGQRTEDRGQKSEVRKKLLSAFCFLLSVFCFLFSVYAKDVKQPVVVDADQVEYLTEEKRVIGTNNVEITYEDMTLRCDRVSVDIDTKEAYAEGNVVLSQGESVFRGKRINYNFQTNKGTILEPEVSVQIEEEPSKVPDDVSRAENFWYGKGGGVEKVADKEYHINQGYITTCNLDKPHYRLQTKRIKIFLDDKVTARHVLLFVGKVPVLYLPFYTHPLHDKRPRVTIIPGRNNKWGPYVLTAWRYHFNEGAKGRIHLDYRDRKGVAEGIDYNYKTKGWGEGIARLYYMQERDTRQPEGLKGEDERWRAQLRHKWEMDDKTLAIAEYHEMSDGGFIKDYFYREEYEREHQPESYVSITRTNRNYNLNSLFQKRANRFFSGVEYLPELKLDIPGQRLLKDVSFYYRGETSVGNLNKKTANSSLDSDVVRVDSYNEVSYGARLASWLSLTPYIGTRQTFYSKNIYGEADELRGALYSGIKASSKFYKIFRKLQKPLRHIITPTIEYKYIHDPTVSPANLMSFDDIDSIRRDNTVTLSLENKIQTKGEKGLIDLATLIVSGDYHFKTEQGSTFSYLTGDLELRPYHWLGIEADTVYDTRIRHIDMANIDLFANPSDRWQFGLGDRYRRNYEHELTTEVSYRVNPKWKVRAYERFDFKEIVGTEKRINRFKEQEYTISRDLHCWIGEITYNTKKDGDNSIWLIFRLKAFPETPLRFNTGYSRPKPEL